MPKTPSEFVKFSLFSYTLGIVLIFCTFFAFDEVLVQFQG